LTLSQLGEGTLMRYLLLPFTPRYILLTIALLGTLALAGVAALDPETLPVLSLPLAILGGLLLLGICDLIQTRHAILRNYPIAAHIRFILEHIRPELRQYFFEAEKDGTPFPRDKRALVYRAKLGDFAHDTGEGGVSPSQRRNPGQGRGLSRVPFARPARARSKSAGAPSVSLQRSDHLLQRPLFQAGVAASG
jgi:hypothetical protein